MILVANHLAGLVRFVPRSSATTILIGQPVDARIDIGLAVRRGEEVRVEIFSGSSVLAAGSATGKFDVVDRILSPLSASEVGTIRCIGLNVCKATSSVALFDINADSHSTSNMLLR